MQVDGAAGLRARAVEVPRRLEHDRHAVGAHRASRRRLPHAARRPRRDDNGAVRLGLLVMPLAVWLWIGGGLMAVGTVLAAWPGRRRRPTDPVSAPIPERRVQTPPPPEETGRRTSGSGRRWVTATVIASRDRRRPHRGGRAPAPPCRPRHRDRPRASGWSRSSRSLRPARPRSTGKARARCSASPRPTSSARRSRRATAPSTSCPTDAAASCSSTSSRRGAHRASRSTPSSCRSAAATCRPATPRS